MMTPTLTASDQERSSAGPVLRTDRRHTDLTSRSGGNGLTGMPSPALSAGSVLDHPRAPLTLDGAGLSLDLVLQLALKTLHFAGELTGTDLARRLGLRYTVIEPVLEQLKGQRQVEIVGGAYIGGPSYLYRITDSGRARAAFFLQGNKYVGIAPVPYQQYVSYMNLFARTAPRRQATRERVKEAFSHLVLKERMFDQIGPAVNAGRSLFIYGPPGNGKTVISQAIRSLLEGTIAIPHAIEIEGQIVRLFDPVNHEPLDPTETCSLQDDDRDCRWVPCRRPLVMVGGELELDALQLRYNPHAGFYRAPLHMMANGGVFVIDDFGRQRCSPAALLNRWIVPLESRIDFLTLESGQTFTIPFAVLVIFATNLKPSDLMDEAFMRRIHAKVLAEPPTREEFLQIFEDACAARDLPFDRLMIERLLDEYYRPHKLPIRGCHPRDLIGHALSLADYHRMPRALTYELLTAACDVYFVADEEVLAEFA
jgi:predicted ATPase with chaperone activity